MPSKKNKPKQAKATAKKPRIGKKKRAEVIEYYRPIFEKNLSRHLERNQLRDKRPILIFSSVGIPKDLPTVERGDNESCPVCSYRPYAPNITARPRLTLTEKDAEKFLRELGFADDFAENYMKEFRNEKIERRENRKGAWGIPNIGDYISWHGAWLLFEFPWLTITAAASILEDLLIENKYTPGKGTIKTRLEKFVLTLQTTASDPDCTCECYTRLKAIAKTLAQVGFRSLPKQYRVRTNDERQIFESIRAIEKPKETTEKTPG